MGTDVCLQVCGMSKLLGAHTTVKGTIPSVYPVVSLQMSLLNKGHRAEMALEGPLLCWEIPDGRRGIPDTVSDLAAIVAALAVEVLQLEPCTVLPKKCTCGSFLPNPADTWYPSEQWRLEVRMVGIQFVKLKMHFEDVLHRISLKVLPVSSCIPSHPRSFASQTLSEP